MLKWTHLAHYARIWYFLSPTRQNRGRVTFPFPPVKSGGEVGGRLKKSLTVMEKPAT
jgi:hypothetical protein